MWSVTGTPAPIDWLDFTPVRVLYEFDGPKIFTCKDLTGQPFLAFQCSANREAVRFLVVPFGDGLESRLTTGDINLRDALIRPQMWIFDLDNSWKPVHSWRVRANDFPSRLLPRDGVMLWSHLQPHMYRERRRSATGDTRVKLSFLPPHLAGVG